MRNPVWVAYAASVLAGTAPVQTARLEWDWAGDQTLVNAVVAVANKGADIRQAGQTRRHAVHVSPASKDAALAELLAGLPDGEYTLFVRVMAADGQSSPWSAPLAIQKLGGRVTDAIGTLKAAPVEPSGLRVR
jgi:hypothetical protein